MTFEAPVFFAVGGGVFALIVGYVLMQRRTRRQTVRFASFAMLEKIAPRRPGGARHAGVAIVLVGLTLLVVAMAGPTADVRVPRNRATVMLAIDVSLSMQATDVSPNRLAAAKEAATNFVDDLTPGVNLGLISFAGIATVLVSPTTDRAPAIQAIDGLKLDERTATGEAIISAVQTIDMFSRTIGGSAEPVPARIVLMTDGKRTVGRTEQDAAQRAKDAGIPVSVIAFGTDHGSIDLDGEQIPVPLDTASMRQIAQISGGEFHTAHTAAELKKVYAQLGEQIGYETVHKDASRPWLIAGSIVVMLGVAVAVATSGRIP
ncbi:MAG: VWA domain-containing protein [Nakamurella sp.]